MKVVVIAFLFLLSGCTISVNLIHTNGANDKIIESQKADADIPIDLRRL